MSIYKKYQDLPTLEKLEIGYFFFSHRDQKTCKVILQ